MNQNWPKSIDTGLLCITEDQINYRAQAIVELLIDDDLTDKKFLDFGCQNDSVVIYSKRHTSVSVGYGNLMPESKCENTILTNSFEKASEHGPFDVILAFDVIDHIEDPEFAMSQIFNLIKYTGKVYLRTHPWSSRHATHDSRNLAYIHLFEQNQGIFHNKIQNYETLIEQSGFKIIKVRKTIETIESFFSSVDLKDTPGVIQYADYLIQKNIRWF